MIANDRIWSFLAVFCLIIPFICSSEDQIYEKDVFSKNIGQLLNYKNGPSRENHKSHVHRVAKDYMTKLFQEFNENSFYKNEITIRSILPVSGFVNNTEALVFKLESIAKDENILRAELHFRQNMKPHFLRGPLIKTLTVIAGCQSCQLMYRIDRIKSISKVWTIWNLKDITINALNSNSSEIYANVYRNQRLLKANSMLNKNVPFLLIYSQPKKISIDTLNVEDNDDVDVDDNINNDNLFIKNNRVKRSINHYYGYNFDNENSVLNNVEEEKLSKFEQFQVENEINHFIKQGPKSLKTRKQQKQRKRKHRKSKNHIDDPMQGFGTKRRNKNKQENDNSLKILLLGKDTEKTENFKNNKCKKEKYTVNFRDIGWQDVIIQPTVFDSYYCSGSCEFPINMDSNPTNHALIQSLLNKIYPSIPNVCCAPDKMDSLTLLFFDENGNVVLKNFPKMIVSSCSCL